MFCPSCGANNERPSSKFCLNCGAKLPIREPARQEAPRPLRQPDPVAKEPPSAPTWQVSAPRRNYIARHWRGELSLPVSYWVNGLLLGMALNVAAKLFQPSDEYLVRHFTSYGVWMSLYLVGLFAIGVWQLVGIWRSASHREETGKSGGWGALAKIAVAIGAIQLSYALVTTGIPLMRDNFHIIAGDNANGRYQLRVLRDATELEINGPITFGLTEDVRQTLDAQPTIHLVHLNSPGGRVAEARALRDLISERALITYTATGCASACTIAYMAGRERWIDPKASLGFHEYSLAGVSQPESEGGYAQERRNWMGEGVPEAFISKAFATPASTLWKPTAAELVEAHVVTKYAGMADTALSGLNMNDLGQLDAALKGIPAYAALRDVDPIAYQRARDIIRDGIARGHSLAEIRALTIPLLQGSLLKHLPNASDAAIRGFTQLVLDEMKELYGKDPALCFDYIFNVDNGPNRAVQVLTPEIQKREFEVMGQVLESAVSHPAHPIPAAEAQAEMRPVIDSLVKTYGKDVALIAEPQKITDKAKGCEMLYALYAGALKLPGGQSSDVLRYIFSSH